MEEGWPRRRACFTSNHQVLPRVYPGQRADVKERALWAAEGKQGSSGLGFKSSHVCPLPFLHPAPLEKTLWAANPGHNAPLALGELTLRHSRGPGSVVGALVSHTPGLYFLHCFLRGIVCLFVPF